jgi:hypothetical protein
MTLRERNQDHSHEFLVIQFLCFSCHREIHHGDCESPSSRHGDACAEPDSHPSSAGTCGYLASMRTKVSARGQPVSARGKPVSACEQSLFRHGTSITMCVDAMATASARMICMELRTGNPNTPYTAPMLVDSTAAKSINKNDKDTNRTRHIERRMLYTQSKRKHGNLSVHHVNGNEHQLHDLV